MGRPFIWGGDFQVPPEELAGAGFFKKLRAAIVAPGASTLRHSDRTIDYWIVADTLSPFIMDVDVVDASISLHRPVLLRFSSEPRERHLKLQKALPLPATWAEGPTLPAVFDSEAVADLTAVVAADTDTDRAADAVHKGIGVELDALYVLARPPTNEWNPPTETRGGAPVIVLAGAKCGKPTVAPRTPAEGNKWRHLAADLREALSLWERITEFGHSPGVQSDEPRIHRWQSRFKHICHARPTRCWVGTCLTS